MWLPWQDGALFAVLLAGLTVVLRRHGGARALALAPFSAETGLVLALYALWRYAGHVSPTVTGDGSDRGHAIWDLERVLHLPSEVTWQRAVLPYPDLVRLSNVFYASLHVPVLIAFLVWLFVRHREAYPRMRNVLAGFTAISLAMHTFPVAPPRLLPDLHVVDTGLKYGQSVYGNGLTSQLAAMPSVHVGWAVIVGVGVVVASGSPWRWLALLYPALTTVAVVVTGNHYWLDGIVAVGLIAAVAVVDGCVRRLGRRVGARSGPVRRPEPAPVPLPVGAAARTSTPARG